VDPAEARRVLGVAPGTAWPAVRRAYRDHIRHHHPDRAGSAGVSDAVRIIEAFRVLDQERRNPSPSGTAPPGARAAPPSGTAPPPPSTRGTGRSDHGYTEPGPAEAPGSAWSIPLDPDGPPAFVRVDADTLRFSAPADETFRWLLEGAHEIGAITYLDRSGPLFEVLCRFLDEPATSLLVTLQGRADGTDALCSAESIEARPGPPTAAVVDVYEAALQNLTRRSRT
jgi:hypothetical protein